MLPLLTHAGCCKGSTCTWPVLICKRYNTISLGTGSYGLGYQHLRSFYVTPVNKERHYQSLNSSHEVLANTPAGARSDELAVTSNSLASKLSLSFSPVEQVQKYLKYLDALVVQRSTVSSRDVVTLMIDLHDTGIQVPLEYYRFAVDICSFRGDISAVDMLLGLSKRNISVHPIVVSTGLDPHDELLQFSLAKLARCGYINDTLALWKKFATGDKRYLEDGCILKAIMRKSLSNNKLVKPNILVLERLQTVVESNCWDESPLYYTNLMSNLKSHFRSLRWSPLTPERLQREKKRLDRVVAQAAARLPSEEARRRRAVSATMREERLDSHSSSVLEALKVQCLAALCCARRSDPRVGGRDDAAAEIDTLSLLAEAKVSFYSMLQCDACAQLSPELKSAPTSERSSHVIDSGDVVSDSIGTSSSNKSSSSTSGIAVLQQNLLDILSEQRVAYSCVPAPTAPLRESLLPHVLRASLLKHSNRGDATRGVDVGADYLKNNKVEQNRRALLDLLREMSLTTEGNALQ